MYGTHTYAAQAGCGGVGLGLVSLVGSSAQGQTISWHPARWPKCRLPTSRPDITFILPLAPCLRVLYLIRESMASHPGCGVGPVCWASSSLIPRSWTGEGGCQHKTYLTTYLFLSLLYPLPGACLLGVCMPGTSEPWYARVTLVSRLLPRRRLRTARGLFAVAAPTRTY